MDPKKLIDFKDVDDLSEFTAEALRQGIEDGYAQLDPILDKDEPSADEVKQARELHSEIQRLEARLAEVEAEDAEIEKEMADMRAQREARAKAAEAAQSSEEEGEEGSEEESAETNDDAEGESEEQEPEGSEGEVEAERQTEPQRELVNASTKSPTAGRRPAAPPKQKEAPVKEKVAIRAALDTGVRPSGDSLDDMIDVAKIAQHRFGQFRGVQGKMQLGIASFEKPMSEDLIVLDGMSDEAQFDVVRNAGSEKRLPGKSLTAANTGWCGPLETIYDLCDGGSTDGLWDVPEIRVNRGGVRHIPTMDFSSLYAANTTPGTTAAGWYYTEAQVQSGTQKVCIEVPCPTWQEDILDVAGICLTSSLLTNTAFPELVNAFLKEAMVAHQVLVAQNLLQQAIAAAGTPLDATDSGTTVGNTLGALELVVEGLRQQNRWPDNETVEVAVPHWLNASMRYDLSMRNGVDFLSVSDADLARHFAARKMRVQFVYGITDLAADAVVYPGEFTALVYRAGSFVKGAAPVINLSTLYDSSLLADNKAIQLFFEEGVMLLQRCATVKAVNIRTSQAGITGAASNTETVSAAVV